jgi:hypothetical protein
MEFREPWSPHGNCGISTQRKNPAAMSTARELLTEFFDSLRNLNTSVDRCVSLFADDGVFEFPYMPTIGIPARFQGHEAIHGVLELIRSHFPAFTLSNIEIHDLKDGPFRRIPL